MSVTYSEIVQKCTNDQLLRRDLQEIATTVSASRIALQEYWLTDRGLVSDLFMKTGSLAMPDSVLTKLEALASQSRSIRAIFNRLENDPKGLNFGDVGLRAQIQYLTPVVFTEEERDILLSLPIRDNPVSVHDIQKVMEGH